MTNSADPDQLASEEPTDLDLHCLQRQVISSTRVNIKIIALAISLDKAPFSTKKVYTFLFLCQNIVWKPLNCLD